MKKNNQTLLLLALAGVALYLLMKKDKPEDQTNSIAPGEPAPGQPLPPTTATPPFAGETQVKPTPQVLPVETPPYTNTELYADAYTTQVKVPVKEIYIKPEPVYYTDPNAGKIMQLN